MMRPNFVSTPMIATMYSGATPCSVAMRSRSSRCSSQNCTPSEMRSSLTNMARYSHQGTTCSAGRVMSSMIFGCGCALASSFVSLARLSELRFATSSMNVLISGRFTSKRSGGAMVESARAGTSATATASTSRNLRSTL